MRVFFNASLLGREEFGDNYDKVVAAIQATGHELMVPEKYKTETGKFVHAKAREAANYHEEIEKLIKKADVAVFEVSYPSTSVGYEIAMAMQNSKPVVALHVKGAPKNPILSTLQDDRLQVIEYTLSSLNKQVKAAVDYALEQMDTRFNFFINPEIGNFLDWVSKHKKLPRAVFLRQLIERDMVKQGYTG